MRNKWRLNNVKVVKDECKYFSKYFFLVTNVFLFSFLCIVVKVNHNG